MTTCSLWFFIQNLFTKHFPSKTSSCEPSAPSLNETDHPRSTNKLVKGEQVSLLRIQNKNESRGSYRQCNRWTTLSITRWRKVPFVELLPERLASNDFSFDLSFLCFNDTDSTGSTSKEVKKRQSIRKSYSRCNQKIVNNQLNKKEFFVSSSRASCIKRFLLRATFLVSQNNIVSTGSTSKV